MTDAVMFKPINFDPRDPSDNRIYSLDFTLDLNIKGGETISSASASSSIIDSTNDSDLITQNVVWKTPYVYVRVSGGTDDRVYLLSFTIVTSFGNQVTRSGILPTQIR